MAMSGPLSSSACSIVSCSRVGLTSAFVYGDNKEGADGKLKLIELEGTVAGKQQWWPRSCKDAATNFAYIANKIALNVSSR